MTLFKLHYFLLLITVCKKFGAVLGAENLAIQNDVVLRNTLIDRFAWLQRFDRGCVAKPNIDVVEPMRYMSLDAVSDLLHEAYVELQCSYLYSALTYLHLIKTYMSRPMTLVNPTGEELNSLLFSVESATMIALAHVNPDQSWNNIKTVMWLFHTFVEKTANFMVRDQSDSPDIETVYKSVISPYNAIIILLEECTVTIRCIAYDQVSGRPDNLTYVEKIRNVLTRDRKNVNLQLSTNKNRFWIQTEWNEQLGFAAHKSIFVDYFVNNLLFGMAREGGKVMITLAKVFGVQLEWQSITRMLEYYYGQATDGITVASLQEYINVLQVFQNQFIRVLKAIAMRIVIMYLLQLQHTIRLDLIRSDGHNKRVVDSLKAFVACVYLNGEQHLMMIIDLMNKPWQHYQTPEQIDNLIIDIQELLIDTSSPDNSFGVRFDVPIINNVKIHKQATKAAIEFAREPRITVSGNPENILVIEVYVEFVKRMADFRVIHSFANLTTTDVFRRFKVLENAEQLRRQ